MSCESFEDGSSRLWVVFASATDAQRFRTLGRHQRTWPRLLSTTITAAIIAEASDDSHSLPVGTVVWQVLIEPRDLTAILKRLKSARGKTQSRIAKAARRRRWAIRDEVSVT